MFQVVSACLQTQVCFVTHAAYSMNLRLAQTKRCNKGSFMPSEAATTYGVHILSVRRNLFTQLTVAQFAYEGYANAQLPWNI